MEIGFVAIGHMGLPMAANLLRSGNHVRFFDTKADGSELRALGGERVDNLAQLARAPLTISMLPDGPTTLRVLFDKDGLAPNADPGHVHMAMGTIGIAAAYEAASRAEAFQMRFVDAPVSGSVSLARSAQLTTMVGCESELIPVIKPVLAAMTRVYHHVGPPGAGSAMKLAVNMMVAAANQAIAEALVFAEATGISLETAYDAMEASAASSPYLGYKRSSFLDPDGTPVAAPMTVIAKDIHLALRVARERGLLLPLAQAAADVIDDAMAVGLENKDMSRVLDLVRMRTSEPELVQEMG